MAADLHHFNADPDPTSHFYADTDPDPVLLLKVMQICDH
jgi:hypothetical protein